MNKIEFIEKVNSLTEKQLLQLVVDAVKNPVVNLDFDTYGSTISETGECFGCAATNVMLKLTNKSTKDFKDHDFGSRKDRANVCDICYSELHAFEYAIDDLRKGCIKSYNDLAMAYELKMIILNCHLILPCLDNDNYLENIKEWEKYINTLN